MVDLVGMFDQGARDRCLAVHGFDPDDSFREMLLEVRMGGPAYQRLCATLLLPNPHTRPTTGDGMLTPQQRRVMMLLCRGLENIEIAEVMGVGLETVKSHSMLAVSNLKGRNRTHASVLFLLSEAAA